MWALIGEREEYYQTKIGGPWEIDTEYEIVALFTQKVFAEDYIYKSKLKNPQRRTFCGNKVFRNNSLLCNYQRAEIEEYIPEQYEVDPVL